MSSLTLGRYGFAGLGSAESDSLYDQARAKLKAAEAWDKIARGFAGEPKGIDAADTAKVLRGEAATLRINAAMIAGRERDAEAAAKTSSPVISATGRTLTASSSTGRTLTASSSTAGPRRDPQVLPVDSAGRPIRTPSLHVTGSSAPSSAPVPVTGPQRGGGGFAYQPGGILKRIAPFLSPRPQMDPFFLPPGPRMPIASAPIGSAVSPYVAGAIGLAAFAGILYWANKYRMRLLTYNEVSGLGADDGSQTPAWFSESSRMENPEPLPPTPNVPVNPDWSAADDLRRVEEEQARIAHEQLVASATQLPRHLYPGADPQPTAVDKVLAWIGMGPTGGTAPAPVPLTAPTNARERRMAQMEQVRRDSAEINSRNAAILAARKAAATDDLARASAKSKRAELAARLAAQAEAEAKTEATERARWLARVQAAQRAAPPPPRPSAVPAAAIASKIQEPPQVAEMRRRINLSIQPFTGPQNFQPRQIPAWAKWALGLAAASSVVLLLVRWRRSKA